MPSIDDIKSKPLKEQFDVVVDSIFGFGFTGAPRPPFDKIIEVCVFVQLHGLVHVHFTKYICDCGMIARQRQSAMLAVCAANLHVRTSISCVVNACKTSVCLLSRACRL